MFSSSLVVVDIIFPADSAAGKILTTLLLLSNESVLVVLVVAREKASAILPSTRVRVCFVVHARVWKKQACDRQGREEKKQKIKKGGRDAKQKKEGLFSEKMEKKTSGKKEEL